MAVSPGTESPPAPPADPHQALGVLLSDGPSWGDCTQWLPALPPGSVDLWFTSPPYADARAYSRIHPDRYVSWFVPLAAAMLTATTDTGWLVLNIKNRVAASGPLRGQRHPYVYQLVLGGSECDLIADPAFAREVLKRRELPIAFWDERLSTAAVQRMLTDEMDMSRKRRAEVVDKAAAAYILQGALEMMRNS